MSPVFFVVFWLQQVYAYLLQPRNFLVHLVLPIVVYFLLFVGITSLILYLNLG